MAAYNTPRQAGEGTALPGEGSTPVSAEVWEPPAGTGHSLPQAGVSRGDRCGLLAGADDSHGGPREPRRWRIEFPAGMELLSLNQRIHWTKRARITKKIRSDAFYLAKYAKVPHLNKAHITCEYQPAPLARRRDPSNWSLSAKAAVDGLVDAGVLTDDDSTHLDGPDMRLGEPHPRGRIVLIITEVLEAPHV